MCCSHSSLLLHCPVATLNFSEQWCIIHKMDTIGGGLYYRTGTLPLRGVDPELWMRISFRGLRHIKQGEAAKVYLRVLFLFVSFILSCLALWLSLDRPRIGDMLTERRWYWRNSNSGCMAQGSGNGFDRSADKQMDNVSEIGPESWLTIRLQSSTTPITRQKNYLSPVAPC